LIACTLVVLWAAGVAGQPCREHEDALLERIERLERRIAELEGRFLATAAGDPPGPRATESVPSAEPSITPPVGTARPARKKAEPFAFADFTWLNGNNRQRDFPLKTESFTGELRVDVNFTHSFNRPRDNTIGGSSEIFRSGLPNLESGAIFTTRTSAGG
jgi:hypothetical protein